MMLPAQLHRGALLRGCIRMANGRAMAFLSSSRVPWSMLNDPATSPRPVQDGAPSPTIRRQAVDGRARPSVALRRFFLMSAIDDYQKDLFSLTVPLLPDCVLLPSAVQR